MAEISKIQIPGNSTPYDLYDSSAAHSLKTVNSNSLEGSGNVEIPDDQMIWFCTCSTSASTATKTIVFADDSATFSLVPGHTLRILFTYGNTTSSQVKFTCSGVFTDIDAYAVDSAVDYSNLYYMWRAKEVVDFVYDGAAFVMVDSGKADTTAYGLVKLSSSTTSTSSTVGANISAFDSLVGSCSILMPKIAPTQYAVNTSYFTLYDSDWGSVKLKIYGHLAEISGWVKPTVAISGSTTLIDIPTSYVPSDYRPSQDINLLMCGSTYYVWLLRIGADGRITFARYRCTDSYASAGTSTSLPFHASWLFE